MDARSAFARLAPRLQPPALVSSLERVISFAGTSRFRLLGPLGKGGMGTVYRAFDEKLGMAVALKTISGEAQAVDLQRFKREFTTALRGS